MRLNNAWASGAVLRPFLQPESYPFLTRVWVSGFKCKLRDSNSRPPCWELTALASRLCTIQSRVIQTSELAEIWGLTLLILRTCMKTECVISGTIGGLMDPNYCYKISWSLTRLIIKLAGQTYNSTFSSAVDDMSLYYIVSLANIASCDKSPSTCREKGSDKLGPCPTPLRFSKVGAILLLFGLG